MKKAMSVFLAASFGMAACQADIPRVGTPPAPVNFYRGDTGHTGAFPETIALPLSLLWRHTALGYRDNSASPLFSDKTVYFAAGPTFYALKTADGTVRWRFKAPGGTKTAFDTTPALDGGFVYVTDTDSELYKLDAQTGQSIWVQKFSGARRSAPVISGGVVYFGSGNNHCYAVSADSGQTLWDSETQGAITTSPTITGGLVVFASSDGSLYSFSTITGRTAWTVALNGDPSLYPTVYDGNSLFVVSGDLVYALDAASGTKRFQVQLPTNAIAPPTIKGDALYLVTQNNIVYALNSNGTGRKRWQVTLPTSLTAAPMAAGGVLLAATQHGVLTGYDTATGALKWQYVMQSSGNDRQPEYTYTNVASAPIFADKTLFVVSDDGTLSAFRSDAADGISPEFKTLMPGEGSTVPSRSAAPKTSDTTAPGPLPDVSAPPTTNETPDIPAPPAAIATPDGNPSTSSAPKANSTYGAIVADPGSGINPKTVMLQIDGVTDPTATYRPEENLAASGRTTLPDGPHTLSVSLADWRGNKMTRTWSFTIGAPAPPTVPEISPQPPGMPPGMGNNPSQPPPPPPITSF